MEIKQYVVMRHGISVLCFLIPIIKEVRGYGKQTGQMVLSI